MSAELSEGTGLQSFCLLAKSAKGKACTAVIEQALQAPNVFVFGELLDMPNVKQVLFLYYFCAIYVMFMFYFKANKQTNK